MFPGDGVRASRANVIARFDNPSSPVTVLFDAHQDTVPVDGMTIAPFDPVERDGRIYGRGACDDKGGLAAMSVPSPGWSKPARREPRTW